MEALLAAFALGTIWFWVSIFMLSLVLSVIVENGSGVWATIWTIGSVISISYIYKWSIITAVKLHPGAAIIWLGIYLLAGALWSVCKWYFYLHKEMNKYKDEKRKFLAANNAKELTPKLAKEFLCFNSISLCDASEHKGDLIRWSTYWPFSVLGTLLNDFIRKIWEYVYDMLQSTYQRMSDAMFKEVAQDKALSKL